MRAGKILLATLTASALLVASISAADARGYYRHRGPGPVLGLVGGVIVGAATIATLPFALLADAARSGPPPANYYGPDHPGYGPPPDAYGYGNGGYGNGGYGNGGYGDDAYGYGPPPPRPPRYYRDYGPPRGYYGY